MKLCTFLSAVDRIIGGIKVQNQFFRCMPERANKLIYQYLMQAPGCGTIRPILPATQGRTAGQYAIPINSSLDRQIMTQLVVIVQVFVAQCQRIEPLAQQTQGIVIDTGLATRVFQYTRDGLTQTEQAIRLTEQQYTAIASDVSTLNIGFNNPLFADWKFK